MTITPEIIYQDQSLLLINKPCGWITSEANTTASQPTIQGWLRRNFQFPIFRFYACRNGIVHRLDKETSGLLLIAKTREAFLNLQTQFKERRVRKTYIALVHGRVDPPVGGVGVIEAPVGRLPWRRDRFGVLPGGRAAVTRYKVIRYLVIRDKNYTLLEVKPETGRTHQIRIHLKYIGHPIVGDHFYAGRKTAREDRKWCPRLFLHAQAISFFHPETGKEVVFESELPEDLVTLLEKT